MATKNTKRSAVPIKPKRDDDHAPMLRWKVREVLAAAGRRGNKLYEKLLHDTVVLAHNFDCTLDELREAILENQGKGYIDYTYNSDFERDEWFLTLRGKAKEGVK